MTSPIPVSPALLRAVSERPVHDAELARAFETGEAHTRRASKGRAKPIQPTHCRFIQRGNRARKPKQSEQERDLARRRRRTWGGMNKMPPELREHYTEGERAALNKIAEQVGLLRSCSMRINAIAKAVGIGRSTFQNAIRKAVRLRHVSVELRPRNGVKNDTNVIRIISARWLTWMSAGIGFKRLKPSEIEDSRTPLSASAEPLHGAYEKEKAAAPAPTFQPVVVRGNSNGVAASTFPSGTLNNARPTALERWRKGEWARPERQTGGWSTTFGR